MAPANAKPLPELSTRVLLVAESAKDAMIKAPDDLVFVGEFDVRGREAKLKAWSVPDPESAPPPSR